MLFFDDSVGVFDEMAFQPDAEATQALLRNGFGHWSEDQDLQSLLALPATPLY